MVPRWPRVGPRRFAWTLAAAAAYGLVQFAPLTPDQRHVLGVTAFAMVLWVSETYPLAATALASSFLLVIGGREMDAVFAAYFDPVVVLLLGGFFLGVALTRHGLDVALANRVLHRAGRRPSTVLLAVMVATAVFSMWISNTASTAIMLPIALGLVATQPNAPEDLPRAFVLGVAAAANIGGIATPIGTTANPLAISFLADAGVDVGFFDWMVRAAPLAVLMVVAAWAILLVVFPIGRTAIEPPAASEAFTRPQWGVMAVFLLTVVAWLTSDLHGHGAAFVALGAVLALFATGLVGQDDITKAGWPTLLLIGGGLALGEAIADSGLAGALADALAAHLLDAARAVVFIVVAITGVALTMFASNTATAVIMMPIAISLSDLLGLAALPLVMLSAVALSMDFLVPVGTPPNAMAYETGHVSVRQMLRSGSLLTVAGVGLATSLALLFW